MNTINDTMLSAFLDGELDGEDLASVEKAIAGEPSVARRLATLKLVNELAKGHARSIEARPLPERVQALLAKDTQGPRRRARIVPLQSRTRTFLPVAASLVLVLSLGLLFLNERGQEARAPLAAHAELLQAIPSGTTHQGADFSLTPQFSFISNDQSPCRTYRLDQAGASSTQIACLEDAGWTLQDSFPANPGQDNQQYLPATARSAGLEARLDSLMQGAPLSRKQEQSLMNNDWQAL